MQKMPKNVLASLGKHQIFTSLRPVCVCFFRLRRWGGGEGKPTLTPPVCMYASKAVRPHIAILEPAFLELGNQAHQACLYWHLFPLRYSYQNWSVGRTPLRLSLIHI